METKHSVVPAFGLLVLFQPLLAFAQQIQDPAWDCARPWHMWHGGWGFGWMFPLFMLFIILVGIAIFFLGHRSAGTRHQWGPWQMMERPSAGRVSGDPTYSALQILNERFAKGEIEKQEYEEKKGAILSSGPH
jgi:putative membrane protein